MSIVVTGGAGFIGHHLVARLCANRAAFGAAHQPIVVVDNLHRGSRETLAPMIDAGAIRFIEGDIRDADLMAEVLRGAEYVFHLAAQANVMGAEADPDYAFTTNVLGTYRILRAAAEAGVRRLIFTSSREVYGQPASLPVAESAPLAPKNAYGASKAAAEMSCRTAAARDGLEIVALRLANVYGLGDTNRVIPLWLERAARGEDLLIYGGKQVIDFVWAEDVVSALVRAALVPRPIFAAVGLLPSVAENEGFFAALNVGTGHGTPIHELAERIRDASARSVDLRLLPARAAEVESYAADITLMRATLDLRPEAPLAYLPMLAQEAQRQAATSAPVAATAAVSGKHPHLTLVTRESR